MKLQSDLKQIDRVMIKLHGVQDSSGHGVYPCALETDPYTQGQGEDYPPQSQACAIGHDSNALCS